MPVMDNNGVSIYYELHGNGYPLVLFAPGGMNSMAQMWFEHPDLPGQPMSWIDPRRELADRYQVVAMDQRNAGQSTAPVRPSDGWPTYTSDHLALLNHLGIGTTHVMGGCIGSSYCLGVGQAAPDRVTAAVLQNPIGLSTDNRKLFFEMFDRWAEEVRSNTGVDEAVLDSFKQNMFGGDFVFSVSREFVRNCRVPLLVLAGNDPFHPREVAEEIADLAPSARLVLDWAGPERYASTAALVREFLDDNAPALTA
jgi:pimeloyl-ACP methyl ester carboxylesterase